MEPLSILKKDFLNHTNKLIYRPNLQGQKVDDGIIYIGDRVGPECELMALCHELAHFVEIDDDRMMVYGWGLKYAEVWVYDRWCSEPKTMQMTERELRVAAYQANLQDYIGLEFQVDYDITNSFEHIPDFWFVPLEDGSLWSTDKNKDMGYSDKVKSRQRWLANRAEELRSEFTMARFISEFGRKIQILERD